MKKHTKNNDESQDVTPYAQIPVWLIRGGKDVTHGALRMYAALKTYTKNGHNTAFPSQKKLADDMGVSTRQVRTMMHQLEECGGVRVALRQNDDGTRGRNYIYTLAWDAPFSEEWKETSGELAEENFHSPARDGETVEESCRPTVEENFRSTMEENFHLTTPNELTPNISRKNHLQEVPLSGAKSHESFEEEKSDPEELERIKQQIFEEFGMRRRKKAG